MIKDYLVSGKAQEVLFTADYSVNDFLKHESQLGLFNRHRGYQMMLGLPLGVGESVSGVQGPLYRLYGLAHQLENGDLFGRLVPSGMDYKVTLKHVSSDFEALRRFAITDDIQQSTLSLVKQSDDSMYEAITSAIIDPTLKLIILTFVAPSQMKDQELKSVDEEKQATIDNYVFDERLV